MTMTQPLRAAATVLVAVLVFACGPGAREKTINTTLEATNAARAAMTTWDDKTEDAIVAHATDEASGQAELAKQQAKRDQLIAVFEAVYYTIAVAATSNSDQNVADMLVAAGKLWDAYQAITGHAAPAKEPSP